MNEDEDALNFLDKIKAFGRGASKDILILIADSFLPVPAARMLANGFKEIENERLRKSITAIKIETEKINPDTDHLLTEEFYDIFTLTFNKMLQTRSKEKIDLFAKILANEMSTDRLRDYNEEWKESFIKIIADLSTLELELLYEMHQGQHRSRTRKEAYSQNLEKNATLDSLLAKGLLIEAERSFNLKFSALGGLLTRYMTTYKMEL